ncbi:MAG TPA: glycosyltransferase family 39 protein, partial [Anaerolineae bacterium]|nr:glycosyltransferase family 39 protein [Anaerolineae bacterium]
MFYLSRITHHASRITHHTPFLLILLLFTVLTLYQSIVLPLGEADDETDHYQYLRFVAQTGHPPFTETERNEAGFKGGLAPLYYWLTAWPVALVGEDTLPDIRRVDARPERHIPTDGLGINHVLHTLDEQWPWRGQVLAWHLVRFLSLPLAWITMVATYALVRRLWPEPQLVALGAVAFIAFLPRFVSSSAVINDDNLIFALTSLLLLIQIIILQNLPAASPRMFAVFGALFGLALITKYFALILIPEVLFTLIVSQVASRKSQNGRRPESAKPAFGTGDRSLPSKVSDNIQHSTQLTPHASRLTPHFSRSTLLPFLAALALTAGPWFAFILLRFNRINELGLIPGLAASLGEPQVTEGLVGLLSGQSVRPVAATYNLPEWLGLLYRSFWFEYGWMQIFAPTWIYGLFTVFLLLAVIGHVLRFTSHVLRTTHYAPVQSLPLGRTTLHTSPIAYLLGLHFLLFLMVVLARYVLSATIDTGQGRHLYPALPVIALIISLGLYHFGFWVLDFGFKIFPYLSTHLLPTILKILPNPHYLQFSIFYLLSSIFYLIPAAYGLLSPSVIGSHYQTLPITITPPADLPITYRRNLSFADGLSLAGFDAAQTVSAGEMLPVTLYWQAGREAQQDYLISLCLQDDDNLAVACWAGHFADGRYPARAWEIGDTLVDTVFIPIPTCYHLLNQSYYLHLELWPLDPHAPEPTLGEAPVLQQTFAEPLITIRAAESSKNLSQTVDIWGSNHRLTNPTSIHLAQALTWLAYTKPGQNKSPRFIHQAAGAFQAWTSSPALNTSLFLPCDDGPEPFAQLATFIAGPTLRPGPYFPDHPNTPPDLTFSLNLRHRTFAPMSSTL